MKKLLTILLALFIMVGCATTSDDKEVIKDRISGIETITYDELIEKIENNYDFILYIGRSDCGDCIEFYPILETYLNENGTLGVYYLNVKEFRDKANSEDATQEEKDFFKGIYETLDFDWTPTLQHRQGETVLNKITYLSMDYYEIEDEAEKEEAKQQNIEDIYAWLLKECE